MRFVSVLAVAAFASASAVFSQTQVSPAQDRPAAGSAQSTASPAQVSPEVAAAEAAIAQSDWKAAASKLDAWVAAHPQDGRALFDAGYVADVQNKNADAQGFYERAIKAAPGSFEAHLSLGLLLAREGKLDEARPELARATQLDPAPAGPEAKAKAWRALAQIDRRNNPTSASEDLLEALKLTPETLNDTLLAAELAEATDQPQAAEAAYRRVLAKDSRNLRANTGLGHVLLAQKRYPEAETALRSALKQAPEDPALTAELATALAAQDKAEALPLLQKLHETHPADENVTRMLAEITEESGDITGADRLDVELLARHPEDEALLVAHGQNLIREGKVSEAFQVFSKATAGDTADPDAWSGLAYAASKTNQPSITLHALTMRSKYVADNASTYFLWATSYDTLHDRTAAIRYYHHFLEAAAGKFPDQEWQARQRLLLLEKK